MRTSLRFGDTGPYPVEDGGWLIVLDHFINEPIYEWSEECEGLPYALTLAMFFSSEPPLQVEMTDIGTLYAHVANYSTTSSGWPPSPGLRGWPELVERGVHRIDPLTETAYEPLVEEGLAPVVVPPLFITGSGFKRLEL